MCHFSQSKIIPQLRGKMEARMFATFDILINYFSAMRRIDSFLCVTLGGNLVKVLSDVKLAARAGFRAAGEGGGDKLRFWNFFVSQLLAELSSLWVKIPWRRINQQRTALRFGNGATWFGHEALNLRWYDSRCNFFFRLWNCPSRRAQLNQSWWIKKTHLQSQLLICHVLTDNNVSTFFMASVTADHFHSHIQLQAPS